MPAGIHFEIPFSASNILANNGITNNAGTLQLGGALIQNTALTGAYSLSLSNASASFAVGTTASSTIKLYGLNTITAPTNGTASGLFQTVATPAADITGTTNVYGGVGTLDLNLASAKVTTATAVNISGHLASLVLRNSNGQSTGVLTASRATLNLFDAVNAADVRLYNAKTPEISGAGATITNLYGFYIESQKSGSVTNAYGVYQAGTTDNNVFLGKTSYGSSTFAAGGNGFLNIFQISNTYAALFLRSTSGIASVSAIGLDSNILYLSEENSGSAYGSRIRFDLKNGLITVNNNTTAGTIAAFDASAVLTVNSTTKGFLPPRMTAAQGSAIATPADGLIIYVTSTDATFTAVGLWCRVAGVWTQL